MLIFSIEDLKRTINSLAPSKIVVVSSPLVIKKARWSVLNLKKFHKDIHIIEVPDGEKAKNWKVLEGLLSCFVRLGLDRKSLVLVLGGGSVGDLAGFACSIYLRGINYIQIPTTLLSQVDSAIGGKTAIYFLTYKNQIGSFYNPIAICIDARFLKTLKKEQLIDGLGEIIKMGFIKDRLILNEIEKIGGKLFSDPALLKGIIRLAIRGKQYFEKKDPHDTTERQILNFGHTIGHAIEIRYKLSHGKAVLIGMLQELSIAEKLSFTSPKVKTRLRHLLTDIGISINESIYKAQKASILHDKKIKADKLILPIITQTGKAHLQEIQVKDFLNFI